MSPIQWVWERFVAHLRENFVPSQRLTLDEMLSLFRGRTPHKVYIACKPGKYGFRINILTDAIYRYVCNAQFFVPKKKNSAQPPVKECCIGGTTAVAQVNGLIAPYFGSGRCVTMDRFFSDIQNTERLLENRITVIGTVMSQRRHVPPQLQVSQGRAPLSTIYACHDSKTALVSYCPRKNKVVLVHSTDDCRFAVADNPANKPSQIMAYNASKGGVDTVDQMCRRFSVKRQTRRWTMSLFYTVVDIAALNTFTLFTFPNKQIQRSEFMIALGQKLCQPLIASRPTIGLQCRIRLCMEQVSGAQQPVDPVEEPVEAAAMVEVIERGYCRLCHVEASAIRNGVSRSRTRCLQCHHFVCAQHVVSLCQSCLNKYVDE
jgi:hypothetical protein